MTAPSDPGGLQFDKVSSAGKPPGAPAAAVACSSCKKPITDVYYHLAGRPLCADCREKATKEIDAWKARGSGKGAMLRAAVFGFGAAIAGAAIYYAVMAYLNLEIGLVAILIGWMVGRAIQKATHNFGGTRYQVLAVALTYTAVAMAYAPFAFQAFVKEKGKRGATSHQVQSVDSTALRPDVAAGDSDGEHPEDTVTAAPAGTGTTATSKKLGVGGFLLGIGALIVFTLALPVIGAISSGGSGIISVLIIAFGLMQAWRMTGEKKIDIRGPFRVGASPSAPPAPAT